MVQPLLSCRDLVVRRSGRRVLGPLSIEVSQGELWGIVGPNGAGKTTLLRAVAGLEPVSSGEIELAGVRDLPEAGRRRPELRSVLGFLFQQQHFQADLPFSVEDVVRFGRVGSADPGRDHAAVNLALDRLGLAEMARRLYRELSGGERQKVQLARLLAQEARLLLLDEPTAGLDLDWQERLTALIGEVFEGSEVAVLMVTHEVDRLPGCCNRALLLRDGLPLAAGAPDEVFTAAHLATLYGCAMTVSAAHGRYHVHSTGAIPP